MTPPQSFPRPPRPKSPSPAERSAELADAQKRLKAEAAERRQAAEDRGDTEKPPTTRRPVRQRG